MAVLDWVVRCLPGLSILCVLTIAECALQIVQTTLVGLNYPPGLIQGHNPVIAQFLFISYSLTLHLLAFFFPIRLCRSVYQASNAIEEVFQARREANTAGKEKCEDVPIFRQPSPSLQQEEVPLTPNETIHAIMIPSYKEDMGVLEDTLNVLASHGMASKSYDIFLAMEARDPNAASVAEILLFTFKNRFWHIQYTMHPEDLAGEAPGKSSNISWAAKEVQRKYYATSAWKDVMLTVMDSDTHLLSDYFRLVTLRHAHNRQQGALTDMTLYMPPIVFDRNAHLVPLLVRVADLMWCGAGLSCFQKTPGRSGVAIPTAVYTVTLPLVHLVQGWDAGPEAIGEDMHMMLKCYFATHGKLAVESIASPASQCNISSSKTGIRGWIVSHKARYFQALRHMWGCLDTGFAFNQWSQLGKRSEGQPPRQRKLSHTELELKLSQYQQHGDSGVKLTMRNLVLFVRIFEAHFLPIHLLLVVAASGLYSNLKAPLVHCWQLSFVMDVTAILRAVSYFVMVAYFTIFYERYHRVCVEAREFEMRRAGLYDDMTENFSYRKQSKPVTWLDYLLFPLAGTIFGSAPLFHAALAHFWTDRLVYKLSEKPVRPVTNMAFEEV